MRQPQVYDALIDAADRRWDIAHYVQLTEQFLGPVLELGVGTGRLALALTRAGRDVYGVELDPHMLALARDKATRAGMREVHARLVLGDATTTLFKLQFDAVLATYNFLALTPPARLPALMDAVAAQLAPWGIFAFDLIVADSLPWANAPYQWQDEKTLEIEGARVLYRAAGSFNPVTRAHTIDETLIYPDASQHHEQLTLYQWPLEALEAQLYALGWALDGALSGDDVRVRCGVARRIA